MSKLYVSCMVVALLALALVPAMAAELPDLTEKTVTIEATIGAYVNLDAEDLTIGFTLVATDNGWKPCSSDASATISSNIPLEIQYLNGEDLINENDTSYKMGLQIKSKVSGWWTDTDPDTDKWVKSTAGYWDLVTGVWSPNWGGCGLEIDGDSITDGTEDTGSFWLAPGQTVGVEITAQVYRRGLIDVAGKYDQSTSPHTMTVVYNNG